eukprot:12644980-Ditylum_brightwellii.AAC.1
MAAMNVSPHDMAWQNSTSPTSTIQTKFSTAIGKRPFDPFLEVGRVSPEGVMLPARKRLIPRLLQIWSRCVMGLEEGDEENKYYEDYDDDATEQA